MDAVLTETSRRPLRSNRTRSSEGREDATNEGPFSAALEELPFGPEDATAGAENELLAIVTGPREQVDLPRAITESNFFKNVARRAAAGDTSKSLLREIERFLAENREGVWENSWVTFPAHLLTAYAREIFDGDLYSDRVERAVRRADVGRFSVEINGILCLRIPVSYLLKLAMADAISVGPDTPALVRATGERLMRYFLNDNTSPETVSFHTVGPQDGSDLGDALAEETLRRMLMVQLLTSYANEKFELRSRGQTTQVCLAPHTPLRQKRINELIPDSFYRALFVSPCLSGWDRGEAKYQYMLLCHEVLSRSRLNAIAKLRECGILTRNLVTLPTVSNTSLANNGTHISLGSRRLSALRAADAPEFRAEDEKRLGDLVVKIVEHFLPLFVGMYSAAPCRFDFHEFHPETVLGFLPHELDFTHLRMLWRRWKRKADLRWLGVPLTPFGPRGLDRLLGWLLGLRGDWIPDQRLLDYLVAPLSTDHSPALNGVIGNDERLKHDLAEMGVFDARMSFYTLYRQRLFGRVGFCGFEGRHYSQFASLRRDMAMAANLQRLVTALAYQYVLSGAVTAADIPDVPEVESERRQIFFGAAIGLPTFYVSTRTTNAFLRRILARARHTRTSHRYQGYTRVYQADYRLTLVKTLERDGAQIIEALGLAGLIDDLKHRIQSSGSRGALDLLMKGIMAEAGASTPLGVTSEEFNAAAERYYRGPLWQSFMGEALDVFQQDLKDLCDRAAAGSEEADALRALMNGEEPVAFLRAVRGQVLAGTVSQSVLVKLIGLLLLVIRHHSKRNEGTS